MMISITLRLIILLYFLTLIHLPEAKPQKGKKESLAPRGNDGAGLWFTNFDEYQRMTEPSFDNNTVVNNTVQLGGTAFLHCRVRNLGERTITWVRRRDWHILTSGVFTYTNDERFQVLHSEGSDDWTLQIKYVQKRDNGTYECQVSTGAGIMSHFVNLEIVVPEAFIVGATEYHVVLGGTINLVCVIEKVEYAMEAIKLGSTAIGISTKEGVVLGVEKRIKSPLIINKAVDKIFEIDYHIGCAVSGLMADARTVVERARVECANHWFNFNERMSVESVAQATSNFAIQFGGDSEGEMAISRPFGVGIIFAGIDENGPQLYHLDPSGTFIRFDAKAVGAGGEGATQTLQERYNKSMTLTEATRLILLILKQVMEEKLSEENVEIAVVTKEKLFHMVPKEALKEDLDAIEGVEL